MRYSLRKMVRNFLSVLTGVIIASIILIPFGLFAALLIFSDAAIPKPQLVLSAVLFIAGITIGSFLGGRITAMFVTGQEMIYASITGIILTFICAVINDFDFDWNFPDTGIAYFLFIPFTILGAFVSSKKKGHR